MFIHDLPKLWLFAPTRYSMFEGYALLAWASPTFVDFPELSRSQLHYYSQVISTDFPFLLGLAGQVLQCRLWSGTCSLQGTAQTVTAIYMYIA